MVIRLIIYLLLILISPLAAQQGNLPSNNNTHSHDTSAAHLRAMELSEEKSRNFLASKFYEFKNAVNDSAFILQNSDEPFHYVIFKRGDHPEDIEAQVYERQIGEVVGPFNGDHYNYLFKIVGYSDKLPRMRASQIFIPIKSNAPEDSIAAFTKAELCLKNLKKGKADFHQLYTQYNSEDFSEKFVKYHEAWRSRIDGDLGFFWDDHMMPEFNNVIKNAKKGDVFLVRTQYGIHVVKVTEEMSVSYYKVKLLPLIKNFSKTANPVIIKQANIIKNHHEAIKDSTNKSALPITK